MTRPTATLLVSCPDQHTDFAAGLFLTRIEWELDGFNLPRDLIASAFDAIA